MVRVAQLWGMDVDAVMGIFAHVLLSTDGPLGPKRDETKVSPTLTSTRVCR